MPPSCQQVVLALNTGELLVTVRRARSRAPRLWDQRGAYCVASATRSAMGLANGSSNPLLAALTLRGETSVRSNSSLVCIGAARKRMRRLGPPPAEPAANGQVAALSNIDVV
jgi:hypothetical protein